MDFDWYQKMQSEKWLSPSERKISKLASKFKTCASEKTFWSFWWCIEMKKWVFLCKEGTYWFVGGISHQWRVLKNKNFLKCVKNKHGNEVQSLENAPFKTIAFHNKICFSTKQKQNETTWCQKVIPCKMRLLRSGWETSSTRRWLCW